MRSSVQRRRRSRFLGLPQILRRSVAVVTGRGALVEIRTPHITAARHAERSKDQRAHHIIQRLAFDLFDRALKIDKSFAGITEALAGREMNCERVTVATPVGKTGAMT